MSKKLKKRGELYTMYAVLGVALIFGSTVCVNVINNSLPSIPLVQGNLDNKKYPADYSKGISKEELTCYAAAVYHEARGEDEEGRKAVVGVIKNRTASGYYGVDACDVVTHPWAITGVHQKGLEISDASYSQIEKEVRTWLIDGMDNPIGNANLYHALSMEEFPYWANSEKVKFVAVVGNHIFYEETRQ